MPTFDAFPFSIPAIRNLGTIEIAPSLTFLVGENGSGKSTLLEGIAVAAGLNSEGGSQNFTFATRPSDSILHSVLRLQFGHSRPTDRYFLRAETFFNVATEIEELDESGPGSLLESYGSRSPHEQSFGESVLSFAMNRFRARGLYFLDEPEAALSPMGILALLSRLSELIKAGAQFVIATHSPILSSYPGALIYELNETGIARVDWEETSAVRLTSSFLRNPEQFLRRLSPS